MKKIRIMLTAIAIIAIVGGALAFKASNMYSLDFCTTPTSGSTCPAGIYCPTYRNDIDKRSSGVKVCTTTPRITTNPNHLCLALTQNPTVTKNCTTEAPVFIEDEGF